MLEAWCHGWKFLYLLSGMSRSNSCLHALQVSLPATALRALEVRSSSDVYIAPGFVSKTLQLTTSQLGGSIAASQLSAEQLSISAAG